MEMSENTESTNTIIAMNELASSATTSPTMVTTVIEDSSNSPSESMHCYKRTNSLGKTRDNSSMPSTPLSHPDRVFSPSIPLDSTIFEQDEQISPSSQSTSIPITSRQNSIEPTPRRQSFLQWLATSRLWNAPNSSIPQSAPVPGKHSTRAPSFPEHRRTQRELAETQLQAILNDREECLPDSIRHIGSMSLEQLFERFKIPPFIVKRLSKVIDPSIDSNNLSSISQSNLIKLIRTLTSTLDVRILVFFKMIDENNDNLVTSNEVNQFFQLYFKSIKLETDRLSNAVRTLLQSFHLDTQKEIDFEEFYSVVNENSAIRESFSRFWVDSTHSLNAKPPPSRSNLVQRFCEILYWPGTLFKNHQSKLTMEYFNQNLSCVVLLILYILTNLALFIYVITYRSMEKKLNVFEIFARIGGMLLNFNCSLIVVLMFRQTILFIRSHEILRKLIPVDSHIDFHKFVGRFIAVLAVIHTIGHIINFAKHSQYSWASLMFTTKPNIGWVNGFASLSGVILCIILITMVICSMEWVRRKGYFELFYWTHNLYIVFFILLILHAENFWKWVIVPLAWFLLEKLYSFLTRYLPDNGQTHIVSATIERSDVIKLTIHRPENFSFKPGDYIQINIPSVAFYEFHPFTISSAPEQADILTVHIQAVGNWTKLVYQRFKKISDNENNDAIDVNVYRADLYPMEIIDNGRNERNRNEMRGKKETVIINGPYSSCARYIFDCEHAILIGAGIGVTPYASILSSLMAQFRATQTNDQLFNSQRTGLIRNRRLKQVDFIWMNRDHKSFEWFLKLLLQFEQEQETYLTSNPDKHRFLNIHLYFTNIKDAEFIGYYPLHLVTQLSAHVIGEDVFTGLKSRTRFDRPKWDEVFTQIRSPANNPSSIYNNIGVFYCGNKVIGKALEECCIRHHFRFYKENF